MSTSKKKVLNDESLRLSLYELTEIIHNLGLSYTKIGEIFYQGNNYSGKLYQYLYRKSYVPIIIINIVIKLVGERAYRISWENMHNKQEERKNPHPLPVQKIEVTEKKKSEPKKLIPKPIEIKKSDQPEQEQKTVPEKRKNKKEIGSNVGSTKREKKVPENKNTQPSVSPSKIESENLSDPKLKNISVFQKIGKPVDDFDFKK